jgi:hypothetical protein
MGDQDETRADEGGGFERHVHGGRDPATQVPFRVTAMTSAIANGKWQSHR